VSESAPPSKGSGVGPTKNCGQSDVPDGRPDSDSASTPKLEKGGPENCSLGKFTVRPMDLEEMGFQQTPTPGNLGIRDEKDLGAKKPTGGGLVKKRRKERKDSGSSLAPW